MSCWIPSSRTKAEEVERKILQRALDQPFEIGACASGSHIKHLVAGRPGAPTLVLLHGFGSGKATFYKNLPALANKFCVYSVDWLNNIDGDAAKRFKSTESAEDFFIEALEVWRKNMKLERFILLGHSLGGYIASLYTIRYPAAVERLILASPAGVAPKPPEADPKNVPLIWRIVRSAWDKGYTPQGIIRAVGPLGPKLVNMFIQRRFPELPEEEKDDLREYVYHQMAQPGDHTYLAAFLAPGAWGRNPLEHRLRELTVPTVFIYGESDWMDWRAGERARQTMTVPTALHKLQDAGHQLYIENPEGFTQLLLQILGEPLARAGSASTRPAGRPAPTAGAAIPS
eukprot:tig00021314_g20119.t1